MQPPARALRNLRITSEPQASREDTAIICDGLARFIVAATRHTYYSPLDIFLRDERGVVFGGALGDVWGGWLDLTFLWVAEPFRGQGVFLETLGFQARPFYERFGYEVFAELPDRPAGYTSYFMKKVLREN